MLKRQYTSPELAQLRLADNKIYGLPAASLTKYSSNLNNARGFFGEAIIGNVLNLIAIETPGAYICHSVAFLDNKHGETDHVLIYKDRIILIETKSYSGYKYYKVSKDGVLTASKDKNKGHRIDDSNVFKKVAYYQEQFPNRKVQAILAISRDQVSTWSENGRYKVASLDNIMEVLRKEMSEAEDVKEPAWAAVKQFASMCVKPHISHVEDSTAPVTAEIPALPETVAERSMANRMNYTQKPAALRR